MITAGHQKDNSNNGTVCLLYEEKGRFPVNGCELYKAVEFIDANK